MGCDIHMYIEYKQGNGLPWLADDHHKATAEDACDKCEHCDAGNPILCEHAYVTYNEVSATTRWYKLFGAFAGVRGDGPRAPKGLPENVSEVVADACERYGYDGHSHSYLDLEEFRNILFKEVGLPPTDSSDAFWEKFNYDMPHDQRPPDYTSVVNYCDKLKEEKSLDKQILGPDTTTEVQVRLVFWFDN